MQFATFPFDLKRSFTKTRFRCNFCSDKSVQIWFKNLSDTERSTFHSGAEQYCSGAETPFESSIPGVNSSPIWYTFCDAPFHYLVQCEHSHSVARSLCRYQFDRLPSPLRADCRVTNFFYQNTHPRDSFSAQNSSPQVKKNETKIPTPGHNLPCSNAKRSMKKEHNSIKAVSFQIFQFSIIVHLTIFFFS